MASANVTLRSLSLGSQDSVTGLYAKSFSESTIKMVIVSRGSAVLNTGMGWYAKHEHTGYTIDAVSEGDTLEVTVQNSEMVVKKK